MASASFHCTEHYNILPRKRNKPLDPEVRLGSSNKGDLQMFGRLLICLPKWSYLSK